MNSIVKPQAPPNSIADDKCELAWDRARFSLLTASPFFATILLGLPQLRSASIPIAGTDGSVIFFNPTGLRKLVPDLDIKKLAYIQAHECLHVALGHCWRGKAHLNPPNRQPHETKSFLHRLSNIAADYIVNDIIDNCLPRVYAEAPAKALRSETVVTAGGGTVEGVFQWLRTHPGNTIALELTLEDLLDPPVGETGIESQARASDLVVRAAAAATMNGGSLPAGLRRFVSQMLDPKLPWRNMMREFVTATATKGEEMCWSRPNRRLLWSGRYAPTARTIPGINRLAAGIDCSGSVGEKELAAFAGELQGLWEMVEPDQLIVYWFDSEVASTQVFNRHDELDLEPRGGGGTAFSPVVTAARALDPPPASLVFLTDLGSDDFGEPPPFPVLWIVTGMNAMTPASQTDLQAKVPYGQIAACLDC